MELPEEKVKSKEINAKTMIIYGQPKMGKTTLLSELDDALIVDLEKGSKYLDALKIEINSYEELIDMIASLERKKKELGKNPYKYGVIDTVTKLESVVAPLMVKLYKRTPMGKNFPDGGDVLALPNGAGYKYLRDAMDKISNIFQELFDVVIFVAHLKDKSINKEGREITSRDINLTGKMAQLLPANVDAVGFLFRDRKNNMFLSFKASDELIAGARPNHLKGQDIQVATNTDGEITYHWDKIFIPEN